MRNRSVGVSTTLRKMIMHVIFLRMSSANLCQLRRALCFPPNWGPSRKVGGGAKKVPALCAEICAPHFKFASYAPDQLSWRDIPCCTKCQNPVVGLHVMISFIQLVIAELLTLVYPAGVYLTETHFCCTKRHNPHVTGCIPTVLPCVGCRSGRISDQYWSEGRIGLIHFLASWCKSWPQLCLVSLVMNARSA